VRIDEKDLHQEDPGCFLIESHTMRIVLITRQCMAGGSRWSRRKTSIYSALQRLARAADPK